MLKGIDVSHHNAYFNTNDISFGIIKLTEGRTYVDPRVKKNIEKLDGKQLGFYHFARPDNGNRPEEEAENFIQELLKLGMAGRAVLALDWEGMATTYNQEWPIRWLDRVYAVTKVKPLFYCSKAYLSKYGGIAALDYGLWIPKWGDVPPTAAEIKPWKFWAIWQYSGSGVDKDFFNGNKEQFRKYALGENR